MEKQRYIQPTMKTVMLSTRPLMLGGSSGDDTKGNGIITPGVGGGGGARRYKAFDEDEEDEEDY